MTRTHRTASDFSIRPPHKDFLALVTRETSHDRHLGGKGITQLAKRYAEAKALHPIRFTKEALRELGLQLPQKEVPFVAVYHGYHLTGSPNLNRLRQPPATANLPPVPPVLPVPTAPVAAPVAANAAAEALARDPNGVIHAAAAANARPSNVRLSISEAVKQEVLNVFHHAEARTSGGVKQRQSKTREMIALLFTGTNLTQNYKDLRKHLALASKKQGSKFAFQAELDQKERTVIEKWNALARKLHSGAERRPFVVFFELHRHSNRNNHPTKITQVYKFHTVDELKIQKVHLEKNKFQTLRRA